MSDDYELSNDNCILCRKKMILLIKCLECKNYFCKKCIEKWKKEYGKNSCPFKCLNPSFEAINIQNIKFDNKNEYKKNIYQKLDNNRLDIIHKVNIYKKEKYIYNLYSLKRYKELTNKSNINEINCINYNHLSNCFKSIYHTHYLYNNVSKHQGWICDICENEFEIKSKGRYRCKKCDFDICVKCRILEESGYNFNNIFLSKKHNHLLRDETFKENNWICDVCVKRYEMKTIKRYRCEKCDFDICYNCKINEIKNINGFIYNFLICIFNYIFIIYLLFN